MTLPIAHIHTLELAGFFIPAIFLWATIAALIYAIVVMGLARLGAYRYVWHRALFDLSLYVVIVGVVMFVGGQF